jgi:hypothetical protein
MQLLRDATPSAPLHTFVWVQVQWATKRQTDPLSIFRTLSAIPLAASSKVLRTTPSAALTLTFLLVAT